MSYSHSTHIKLYSLQLMLRAVWWPIKLTVSRPRFVMTVDVDSMSNSMPPGYLYLVDMYRCGPAVVVS